MDTPGVVVDTEQMNGYTRGCCCNVTNECICQGAVVDTEQMNGYTRGLSLIRNK